MATPYLYWEGSVRLATPYLYWEGSVRLAVPYFSSCSLHILVEQCTQLVIPAVMSLRLRAATAATSRWRWNRL